MLMWLVEGSSCKNAPQNIDLGKIIYEIIGEQRKHSADCPQVTRGQERSP